VDNVGKINENVLRDEFSREGFVIKKYDRDKNGCHIEWNYPDDVRGEIMRGAMCGRGAEVRTMYAGNCQELKQRDCADVVCTSDADLLSFLNSMWGDYRGECSSRGIRRGPVNSSSYNPEVRKRTVGSIG
jgi:hypothetical protein